MLTQKEEVADKTMRMFAPELFAEEPLAKEPGSLAFLLKVLALKAHLLSCNIRYCDLWFVT